MITTRLLYCVAATCGLLFSNRPAASQAAFGEGSSYRSSPSKVVLSDGNTNISTGTIAPTIPLLTLPGVSGSIALSLQYTAGSGVKVNEVGSEVGLGWSLAGGGAIVREVKGLPDDGQYGWFTNASVAQLFRLTSLPNSGTLYTAGSLVARFKNDPAYFNNINILSWLYSASQMASYGQYTGQGPNNTAAYAPNAPNSIANNPYASYAGAFFTDNEPDVYTVSLPTGRLQFVFDPEGNPVVLQAQNIKIEPLPLGLNGRVYVNPNNAGNVYGFLQEFRVTTSDGVQYYFGSAYNRESNFDCKEYVSVSTRVLEMTNVPSKVDYTCINKWNLKKIVYPSGEEVNYTYSVNKKYAVDTNNYLQQDWLYTNQGGASTNYNNPYQPDPNYFDYNTGFPINNNFGQYFSWKRSYTARTSMTSDTYKQLESIAGPQGRINFTYQNTARKDVGGTTSALSGLVLVNKSGQVVRQLDFVQHYAVAALVPNAMPYDQYHLLLDRIIDRGSGCGFITTFQFSYNNTPFCRNTATKDDWGYLNSLTYPADNVLVGPCVRAASRHPFSKSGRDRSPNANFAKAFILESITEATGGIQSFAFELHEAFASGQPTPIGGLRIASITKYDGISHATDIMEGFAYRKAGNATQSSGCWGDPGLYAKLQMIHGCGPGGPDFPYHQSNYTPLRESEIRGAAPITCLANTASWYDYYYLMRSDASMYEYASDYIDYSCVTVSHGQKGKTRYEFTSWADAAHQDYVDADTRQRANNLDVCSIDPLHPQNRSSNSMLPLPFLNNDLYAVSMGYADGVTANFPCRSSRAAERSLPVLTTQLTNAGTAVASTYNTYDFQHPLTVLPTVNAVVVRNDMEVLGFSQYPRYFQLYYYNVASQWCPLIKTTEIVYNQGANGDISKSVASVTQVEYSNFFPRKTTQFSTTCSDANTCLLTASGKYYISEAKRAQDFDDGGATANPDRSTTAGMLRNAGMTAAVIEQVKYSSTVPSGASPNYMGASLTEYKVDNSHLLPFKTYSIPSRVAGFVPATTTQVGGVWTLQRDTNYQLASSITGYSTDARPINTLSRDGIPNATIWGYARTLPIATVTNGAAAIGTVGTGLNATAAHTSFEEIGSDGTDSDGWQFPPFASPEAKTGGRSALLELSISPYGAGKTIAIPSGANRHGKLVYSCWVKVPANTFNAVDLYLIFEGQSPSTGYEGAPYRIAPNQDWQYVEKVIDLDAPGWNSGLAPGDDLRLKLYPYCSSGSKLLVDEVRVHRADALMQTMTYAPLVGKTSSTDPSGVTTYYTYDNDNNPRLVLNQKHDIVQRSQQVLTGQLVRPNAAFSSLPFSIPYCGAAFVAEYGSCTTGATFTWDFGDGTTAVNSSAIQSHSYAQQGTYTVSLLVTNPGKGAARQTKTITVIEPFHTDIDIQGPTEVNFCETPNPAPVVLTASVPTSCPVTYRWQRYSSGAWSDVATTSVFTTQVVNGTRSFRCIVSIAGVGDNANSTTLQVITLRGYYANTGIVACDKQVNQAKSTQPNKK